MGDWSFILCCCTLHICESNIKLDWRLRYALRASEVLACGHLLVETYMRHSLHWQLTWNKKGWDFIFYNDSKIVYSWACSLRTYNRAFSYLEFRLRPLDICDTARSNRTPFSCRTSTHSLRWWAIWDASAQHQAFVSASKSPCAAAWTLDRYSGIAERGLLWHW
jgi:hypothetical protein